jgi:hypothetical protein
VTVGPVVERNDRRPMPPLALHAVP